MTAYVGFSRLYDFIGCASAEYPMYGARFVERGRTDATGAGTNTLCILLAQQALPDTWHYCYARIQMYDHLRGQALFHPDEEYNVILDASWRLVADFLKEQLEVVPLPGVLSIPADIPRVHCLLDLRYDPESKTVSWGTPPNVDEEPSHG